MEKNKNPIPKQRLAGGCLTTIILFCLLIYGVAQCTTPKKPKTTTATTTNQAPAENQLPPGKYPDNVYYNGYEWGISDKYERDGKVYAITQVPTFDNFSDLDFLKTAKMVDESDYMFVEIRFLTQNTSLMLQRGTAQTVCLYGNTAEYGGINKGLLWFVVEDGKVLRLNEEQIKQYDNR